MDVREEALMLKKVAFTWLATHLPVHGRIIITTALAKLARDEVK